VNEEALAVFQGVYAATHEARALAQVALAEGELGRLVDAEAHLVEALAQGDERWIRHNRRSLETALERLRTHLGSLAVECATPGAELWIGGQRVAGLPMAQPLRVVSGTVTFEVRASGFATGEPQRAGADRAGASGAGGAAAAGAGGGGRWPRWQRPVLQWWRWCRSQRPW
jgi:hypothetical protein